MNVDHLVEVDHWIVKRVAILEPILGLGVEVEIIVRQAVVVIM
jgi:hypothetical protein